MEDTFDELVVFTLDQQRYALGLTAVERIVRMVEVTPLPKAPPVVLGVINVQGRIVPVLDIRKRFRLPNREVELTDQLLIAHTSTRTVALLVDSVGDVLKRERQDVIAAQTVIPGLEYVTGIAKLEDGLILIHDLDRFLSCQEEKTLDDALRKA